MELLLKVPRNQCLHISILLSKFTSLMFHTRWAPSRLFYRRPLQMLQVELFHPTYDRFLGPPCMLYNPWRDDAISPAHLLRAGG